jgi:lambda family phage minor tail protein L
MGKGINQDFAKAIFDLEPTALLELFTIYYDYQNDSQAQIHLHGGTNGIQQKIIFNGQTYLPMPLESEGFEILGEQRLPRPKLRVSNAGLYVSSLLRKYNNLNGAKVVRTRTFARFLDDANFPNKKNPFGTANPNAKMPDDKYFISRKVSENKMMVEFELVSSLELENVEIPARRIAARYCPFIYRGYGCRYGYNRTGEYQDRPVATVNDKMFVTGNSVDGYNYHGDIFKDTQGNPKLLNSEASSINAAFTAKGLWSGGLNAGGSNITYATGDYVFTYSNRVLSGQGLTANYYQQHPVYYVCRSGHTAALTDHPNKRPDLWVKDACSKKLFGCKLRFANDDWGGINNNKTLPYGGFPGTESFGY